MSEHDLRVRRWVMRVAAGYALLCAGLAALLAYRTW
jgi:hypothetical protein